MSTAHDLGAVFDEHVASEFETKDIEATMRTMVDEPYVWHVPALTGASGGEAVRRFYISQFIGHTPADAVLHPISRTVSWDHVSDFASLPYSPEPMKGVRALPSRWLAGRARPAGLRCAALPCQPRSVARGCP